uniref:DNA-directed DNA polymerase n=1 Tax=Ananas comosus var. bracteatus TaxID=296719 RepID=A0A6V7PY92_ANACO|nr:unnamed protein product [Ananas comosus var. bracteatus]
MDIFNEKELAAFKEIGMADRAGPIKLRYISSTKGPKGSIPHEDLDVSDLRAKSEDLINYLRQDILILGGVMLKLKKLIGLSIRLILRARLLWGHVDVYKPYGENLYYYDVNSLYPYIMKSYPMPCGVPVWHNNLECQDLDNLFGFIEAYVVCPASISHPFLPYKDKFGTLIFPTGKFIGIFYSEELKFARDLGYHIIPLRGILFEAMSSPFEGIISDLYESRLEAKKRGDEPMTFIYKILMNSLYGRFGMNPESTVTEICNQKRYEELMKMDNFQSAEMLTENYYIVNYITNSSFAEDDNWKAPKMSAVQLAAAVTACARIHMYPYISRPDCYYTDTDSVVLGCPLSDDLISSMEMGKFKLEYFVKKGIFLAPKSYMLETVDEQHNRLEKIQIGKKDILIKLGLPQSTKRENVYDSENVWIETRPINVIDLGSKDATTILKYELLRLSVSQSTTEGQKTPTEGQKTPTEGQKTPTEGKNTPTEGQKATTVQPTLYNTKDHDNSIPNLMNKSKK